MNDGSREMTIIFGFARVDPLLFHMDILKLSGRVFKSDVVFTAKKWGE